MKEKVLSVVLILAMIVALAGCGGRIPAEKKETTKPFTSASVQTPKASSVATKTPEVSAPDTDVAGNKVGIAMPTKDLLRWEQDGNYMKEQLEKAGYEVDLQYAGNDIPSQISQIEKMIHDGCKVLVIASIEGDTLGSVLDQAKEKGVKVISYDRLLLDSDAVDYYLTFNNYKVGIMQGEYIEEKLGLKDGKGPFTMEIFANDGGDSNAKFYYNGAMEVLEKYLKSGKLVVKSGQVDFELVVTPNLSTEYAQSRMEDILSANYKGKSARLDAVLCTHDCIALGVTNALKAKYKGSVYPVITGQECDLENVKNILSGKQAMSITKDPRTLASKGVEMVEAIMKGEEVPVNDTETYDNGKGVVPSYLCDPVIVEKSNYKDILIDTGYYTEDDIK